MKDQMGLIHAKPMEWGCQTQISKNVICDLLESNNKCIKKLFSKDVNITKIMSTTSYRHAKSIF